MPHFYGSAPRLVYSTGSYNPSGQPTIVSATPVAVGTVRVVYTGNANQARINGGAPFAIGPSPHDITGLPNNTEYTTPGLELRRTGGNWATPADLSAPLSFGTWNPGSGGGGVKGTGEVTLNLGYAVRTALLLNLNTSYAVSQAGSSLISVGFPIRSAASQSLNSGYAVAAPGSATLSLNYPVRAGGQGVLDVGYEVISIRESGSATLSTNYAVGTVGTNALNVGFGVSAAGAQSLPVGFEIRTASFATLDAGFSVLDPAGLGSATLSVGYAVTATAFDTLALGFGVEGSGVITTKMRMTIRPRVGVKIRN
jgi:hypothetical protein